MTAQNKTTIKTYFETGDRPTQAQFVDLIDSYQDANDALGAIASAAQLGSKGVINVTASGSVTFVSAGTVGLQVLSATTSAAARGSLDAEQKTASMTEAVVASGDYFPFVDINDSNNVKKDTIQGILDLISTNFKIGTFTIDVSTASGTQAITGVGFQPTHVLFAANINGTAATTYFGMDDGTTAQSTANNNSGTANTEVGNTAVSLDFRVNGGTDRYTGLISAFGADGFTVSWTKTGAPTGTARIFYLAIR